MDYIYHNRFVIFLISFVILIFGDIVFGSSLQSEADVVLLIQNLLCSTTLFIRRPRKEIYMIILIISITILGTLYQYWSDQQLPLVYILIFFIYFLMIGYRLFRDVISQEKVTIQTIAAVFCGFLLIALIASLVFMTVDSMTNSFKGVAENRFSDFLYFSFVTLLTVGYGDITPTTELAQRTMMLFGLIGHFYSLFVIAIIVGKYLKEPA